MSHIWVQPGGQDRRVPVEGMRHVYFEHDVPRLTRDTSYVRRRLDAGDLVEVPAPVEASASQPEAQSVAVEEHS